jgi:hypothetical protein
MALTGHPSSVSGSCLLFFRQGSIRRDSLTLSKSSTRTRDMLDYTLPKELLKKLALSLSVLPLTK